MVTPGMPGAQVTVIGERVTITRICQWCNKPASIEVGLDSFNEWCAGGHAQKVWPSLSAEQREIIISGTHGECWDLMWTE